MRPFLFCFVGWSEARSPTAVVRYTPNVGFRASLQPTKNCTTQKIQPRHPGMLLAGIQGIERKNDNFSTVVFQDSL